MGWNWTQTSICDIHSLKHMFFYSHLSVHWNTLAKTERNLEKQPWETPFLLNMLHSPPLQFPRTPPFELESRPTSGYCNAASRPVLQSRLRARQTSACRLKRVYVWVWLHRLSEAAWCCGGFPRSGGNITQSVLKYVISEPCPHTGVQTHAIINSWSLISFDDGTLASFCYWMWWLYCTFVSRGLLQNELLHLLFNVLNSE